MDFKIAQCRVGDYACTLNGNDNIQRYGTDDLNERLGLILKAYSSIIFDCIRPYFYYEFIFEISEPESTQQDVRVHAHGALRARNKESETLFRLSEWHKIGKQFSMKFKKIEEEDEKYKGPKGWIEYCEKQGLGIFLHKRGFPPSFSSKDLYKYNGKQLNISEEKIYKKLEKELKKELKKKDIKEESSEVEKDM